MPYGGAYNGRYEGYPPFNDVPQQFPQHHGNSMQYAVQQPVPQQYPSQAPMYINDHQRQQYAPPQQASYRAPQPIRHGQQYPGYQQAASQPVYNQVPTMGYPQNTQGPSAQYGQHPNSHHRPVIQQVKPDQAMQTRSQTESIKQPQTATYPSQDYRPVSDQWQGHAQVKPDPRVQIAPNGMSQSISRRTQQTGMSQARTKQEATLAASPPNPQPHRQTSASAHLPSSPDPLAPSPNPLPKQPRPQPATPSSTKPKPNVTPSANSPSQRIASQVEIPVMSQPVKRRRSNDGSPMPACEGPNVDYQAALLALSDEYISAAYNLQSLETDDELEQYHKLIAAGIACLESVLCNYRHSDARREARVRLRLATLLFEETENVMETEELLSKGIAVCDRNRLSDLKYAMHHLQVRLMFKNSPKAAIRATDKLVQDVEALRLLHWTYAFRLLRVCLTAQMPGHSETAAALKHLTALSTAADEHRHISLQITAATLEAMIHLSSGGADAVDLAQRAMAAARTHQLGTEMDRLPQMRALLDCLDLSCSLFTFDQANTRAKMAQMHASMDPATRQSGWSKSGEVSIPMLPYVNAELELDTLGIMKTTSDGVATLNIRWMTQNAIYVVGYLLSGLTYLHKDEDRRALSFLREASLTLATCCTILVPNELSQGLKLNSISNSSQPRAQSLSDRGKSKAQVDALSIAAKLLLVFEYCARFEWDAARTAIDTARSQFKERGIDVSAQTTRTMLYLEAMCRQAQGDLYGALSIYQSSDLSFDTGVKAENVERDFRVLSALSSIMILRTLGPSDVDKAKHLYSAIEPYCLNHPNKSFVAAYYMMRSTSTDSEAAIIKTKQYLHQAVGTAKSAANDQILFVVMNAITDMFFHGIVGDQAEKSAQAARTLAKKSGDKVWLCVADNLYGEIKERCGKLGEANAAYKEANETWPALPEALRRKLTMSATDGMTT